MDKLGNIALIALSMAYMIVVGADLFGQAVLTTMTFSEPPRSLFVFHGPVPYDSAPFWRSTTTIVAVLGLLALVTNWTKPRRLWVGVFVAAYMILNAVSFAYVFPEFQAIQSIPYSDTVDPELVVRARTQQLWGGVRWVVALAIGILPLIGLSKPR